jgi:DmsE family decaheme c-type cytochrome
MSYSSLLRRGLAVLALAAFPVLLQAADQASPAAPSTDVTADRSLQGDAVCTRCHDESEARPVLSIYRTPHGVKADARTPGCQSCHGASVAHVRNTAGSETRPPVDVTFGKGSDPQQLAETCLNCHKNGQRTHWAGSTHQSRDVPCTSCHKVHVSSDPVLSRATQPEVCYTCHKTQRAQTHLVSTHPIAAGKMACTDCHNPHGSTGPFLMKTGSINATCYTCHAEKRGPFLWEHGPVTDDCTNCHTPHGSAKTPLLKARTPFLCQECHSGDHAAQQNSGANLATGANVTANGGLPFGSIAPRAQLGGRNCLNCHVLIHGSNHPAGAKYMR